MTNWALLPELVGNSLTRSHSHPDSIAPTCFGSAADHRYLKWEQTFESWTIYVIWRLKLTPDFDGDVALCDFTHVEADGRNHVLAEVATLQSRQTINDKQFSPHSRKRKINNSNLSWTEKRFSVNIAWIVGEVGLSTLINKYFFHCENQVD